MMIQVHIRHGVPISAHYNASIMPIIMAPCHLSLVVGPGQKGDNLIPTLICQLGKIELNVFGHQLSMQVNV